MQYIYGVTIYQVGAKPSLCRIFRHQVTGIKLDEISAAPSTLPYFRSSSHETSAFMLVVTRGAEHFLGRYNLGPGRNRGTGIYGSPLQQSESIREHSATTR